MRKDKLNKVVKKIINQGNENVFRRISKKIEEYYLYIKFKVNKFQPKVR